MGTIVPALIGADPALLADMSEVGARAIIARLERALRAERHRARAGHWAYDLNRHIALRQAFACRAPRPSGLRQGCGATTSRGYAARVTASSCRTIPAATSSVSDISRVCMPSR